MTDEERAILDRLLSADFDGVEQLRAQATAITGVDSGCGCGCPSIDLYVDKSAAPPAVCVSPIPVDLVEPASLSRIFRQVLCFIGEDGYLTFLECVYFSDNALPLWPPHAECLLLLEPETRSRPGDKKGSGRVCHTSAILPGGATIRPIDADDAWTWMRFDESGFTAGTLDGYEESFARDGTLVSRIVR